MRTRKVFGLLSEPAHPKKIHPLHPPSIWDIRSFSPNIGMIDANDPCIPISLLGPFKFFGFWRSKHNVGVRLWVDCVRASLQIVGSIKEAACFNQIKFLPYKTN